MDTGKFIELVKQFPQVWDRNCIPFRDPHLKSEAWERIGKLMECTATTAKDTFKSLREKYVREREKQNMYPEKYLAWQYMKSLSYLDPHIILRKLPFNSDTVKNYQDNYKMRSRDTLHHQHESLLTPVAENYEEDFDKALIVLVRKATPIWDRKNNEYPSKQIKFQLWSHIAEVLNKDVNTCMMRWKGLREKYIRQKNKNQEGEGKWEFLDEMSFLDNVIQYRRKHSQLNVDYTQNSDKSLEFYHNGSEIYEDNSVHDSSSNDLTIHVKSEDDVQDSCYEQDAHSSTSSNRKRSTSDNNDSLTEKRAKFEDDTMKTPERMFGELVAAMLAEKTEKDRNSAMIEIMKVLTK